MSTPGNPFPSDPWAQADTTGASVPSATGEQFAPEAWPVVGGTTPLDPPSYGATPSPYPGMPTYGEPFPAYPSPDAAQFGGQPAAQYGAPYGAPAMPTYAPGYAAAPSYGAPAPGVYAAPPYVGAPSYAAAAYGYAQPGFNVLAIISLVASCATLVFGITAIAGIICGHLSLAQIRRTGERGRGMAIAGLAIGYVLVGIVVGFIALFVFGMAMTGGFTD